jgi:hypothetical protein
VERTSKPSIAGALLIITAIIGFIFAGFAGVAAAVFGDIEGMIGFFSGQDEVDIYGTITVENGTPVENVTVFIIDEEIISHTDENGWYLLGNVPIGNQRIQVEKEGYNTIIYKSFVEPSNNTDSSDFDFGGHSNNEYNFVLEPGDSTIQKGSYTELSWLGPLLIVCAVIGFILAFLTLIGGIFSIKRKNLGLVITGAIAGIFTLGFGLGSILSIIALFIIILSRKEFKKNQG